jgi:hypothetical protein
LENIYEYILDYINIQFPHKLLSSRHNNVAYELKDVLDEDGVLKKAMNGQQHMGKEL